MPFITVNGSISICVLDEHHISTIKKGKMLPRGYLCPCVCVCRLIFDLLLFMHILTSSETEVSSSLWVWQSIKKGSTLWPIKMAKLLNRNQSPKLQRKTQICTEITQDLSKFFTLEWDKWVCKQSSSLEIHMECEKFRVPPCQFYPCLLSAWMQPNINPAARQCCAAANIHVSVQQSISDAASH